MSVPQQLSGFNNQIPPRYAIKNISTTYTVTGLDYGVIFNYSIASGSYTLRSAPASSLGVGFNFWIWNTGSTSSVQFDPNGSETIDGLSTITLRSGEGTQIVSNGTSWFTNAKKTMPLYADNGFGSTRPAASSPNSFAIGTSATASSASAIALGNTANSSGSSSVAIGTNSTSSAGFSIAIGASSSASANYSYALGSSSIASGAYAFAIGYFATASNTSAVAIGFNAQASGLASFAAGSYCKSDYEGKYAYACDFISSPYDSQYGLTVLHGGTTTATPLILWAGSSGSATANNQVILPDNSAYTFSILVVARQSAAGGTDSAAWKIEGLIRRESGVATTTIVGTPTTTVISNVPGWSIAVSADTTNGCLALTATGASATNIKWSATVQTSEVTYA
jgi:hypothetical protein